jgi:predicted MPP superfamily phosphohydrolase
MISDLHATEKGVSNETILKKIEKANPAIVFMLGDMYTRDSTQDEINLVTELVSMVTDAGYYVYFVTGEHDTLSSYVESVRLAGAHVMDYKSEKINVNGNNVEVFGIDNVYFSPTFDLDNEFTLTDGYYSILMAHIPNYEAYSEFGADLTICGDTHGGIARLPFIGLAYYNATSEWFPELHGKRDDIYDKGVFEYDGGEMVITSGIGDYPVPARINNRPEIAVVDIMPEV